VEDTVTVIELCNLAIPVLFVLFHVAEAVAPAERLPRSIGWRLRGFAWFLVSGAIFTNAPRLWTEWASQHSLLHTAGLGLWGAALVMIAGNLFGYLWHRLRHSVPVLWRFHQLHHSAERLDVSGAFMFHPLETFVVAMLIGITGTLLLGVSPEAGALSGLIAFFCACFQHANIRTPRWLGYIVQRPESHSVHHGRGVHASNYADLPLFDLLFGTFRNPETRTAEQGFYAGASNRIGRMLLALDATEPPQATGRTRLAA
jgi:sterol desaturase/sphingolipid hydroxylase (fatty acid hydroxylase superfamily)